LSSANAVNENSANVMRECPNVGFAAHDAPSRRSEAHSNVGEELEFRTERNAGRLCGFSF